MCPEYVEYNGTTSCSLKGESAWRIITWGCDGACMPVRISGPWEALSKEIHSKMILFAPFQSSDQKTILLCVIQS